MHRWLPLVKWLLAIPHYVVLFFLDIAVFFAVIVTWFAIGIITKIRKNEVSRLSGRSGYSTAN